MYGLAGHVLVAAVGVVDLVVVAASCLLAVIGCGVSRVFADGKPDVLARIEKFLLDLLAPVVWFYLVILVVGVSGCALVEQRVREEDNGVVLVFLAVTEPFGP